MKILLLGEYSNLHWSLASGLRELGHEVCVVSDGDFWKDYKRDITLKRKSYTKYGSLDYVRQILSILPKLRGYDVVQIINPVFFDVRADKNILIYKYLRRNNKKIFMGANGADYYWIKTCLDGKTFRYCDFNIFGKERETPYNCKEIKDWIGTDKQKANIYIANDCDGITCCLYEYYASYIDQFKDKTFFTPLSIEHSQIDIAKMHRLEEKEKSGNTEPDRKVNFFIGIQRDRTTVKGTDIMEKALDRLHRDYPDRCNVLKAVSVPYEEYKRMLADSDVILDQIYSYTPAMNALLGMSKGLIAVSGGEPENYEILGEKEIFPIINVLPDEEDIYRKLEELVLHPERLDRLSRESIQYVLRHHNNIDVARRYLKIWNGEVSAS